MSKEVDAIVLIGSSYDIAGQVPIEVEHDLTDQLTDMRSGIATRYDGRLLDACDLNDLYAAEVFMQLGSLVANRLLGGLPERLGPFNHCRDIALKAIDKVSPFAPGECFELPGGAVAIPPERHGLSHAREALGQIFDASDEQLQEELMKKTAAALLVIRSHEPVSLPASVAEGVEAISNPNFLKRLTPESVEYDENRQPIIKIYDLEKVAEDTAIDLRPKKVPYYASLNENNGEEMLLRALKDIFAISRHIKVLD
jgi:hypothetical protein